MRGEALAIHIDGGYGRLAPESMMRYDAHDYFMRNLVKALRGAHHLREEERLQIAAHVAHNYLECVDIGGAHFELMNVTLKWQALCSYVVEGYLAGADGFFAERLMVGVLQWLDSMKSHISSTTLSVPSGEIITLDYVEAATCLAFWKHDSVVETYWPAEALGVLLEWVNPILQTSSHATIDQPRLRAAIEQLHRLHCLTPRRGWYGLRPEMTYQVAEA